MQKGFDTMITNTMSALMTAGTTLKQALVQQSTIKKDEGHAGILRAEIKNSTDTVKAAKEAELKETEEHAADLRAKQTDTLETATAELRDNIDRAREADREEQKQSQKTTKTRETVEEYRERMQKVIEEQRKRPDIGETVTTKELEEIRPDETIDEVRTRKTAELESALDGHNTGAAAVVVDPIRVHKPIDIKV